MLVNYDGDTSFAAQFVIDLATRRDRPAGPRRGGTGPGESDCAVARPRGQTMSRVRVAMISPGRRRSRMTLTQ